MNLLRIVRTIIALLAGAFGGTAIALACTGLIQQIFMGQTEAFESFGATVIMLSVRVLVLMVPVGLLSHCLLYASAQNGYGKRGIISYCAAGVLCGGLFGGLGPLGEGGRWQAAAIFGAWSGICAAIAWLVRRPDMDGKTVILPFPFGSGKAD